MSAAFSKPIVAERTKLAESCRTTARYGPRQDAPAILANSQVPQLPTSCSGSRASAQIRRSLADVGPVLPTLGRTVGQLLIELEHKSADVGRFGFELGQLLALADCWPDVGQELATHAPTRPEFAEFEPKRPSDLSAPPGQHRSSPGLPGVVTFRGGGGGASSASATFGYATRLLTSQSKGKMCSIW